MKDTIFQDFAAVGLLSSPGFFSQSSGFMLVFKKFGEESKKSKVKLNPDHSFCAIKGE